MLQVHEQETTFTLREKPAWMQRGDDVNGRYVTEWKGRLCVCTVTVHWGMVECSGLNKPQSENNIRVDCGGSSVWMLHCRQTARSVHFPHPVKKKWRRHCSSTSAAPWGWRLLYKPLIYISQISANLNFQPFRRLIIYYVLHEGESWTSLFTGLQLMIFIRTNRGQDWVSRCRSFHNKFRRGVPAAVDKRPA